MVPRKVETMQGVKCLQVVFGACSIGCLWVVLGGGGAYLGEAGVLLTIYVYGE